MTKLIFATALLAFFFTAATAQKTETSENVLKSAYALAEKEKKNVIVIFHASWCVWCRKMDKSISDPAIKKYFEENYVITHLVVNEMKGKEHLQNPGADVFLDVMGGKNEGLPYWVVLDSKGKKLADSQMSPGENTGCPANEQEVAHFRKVLKNTSSLTNDQLDAISTRFRKNER